MMKTANELLATAKDAAHAVKVKTQETEAAAGGFILRHPRFCWWLCIVLALGVARAASQTYAHGAEIGVFHAL
jgi:hypothetical protein